jgi:hypothetical protein
MHKFLDRQILIRMHGGTQVCLTMRRIYTICTLHTYIHASCMHICRCVGDQDVNIYNMHTHTRCVPVCRTIWDHIVHVYNTYTYAYTHSRMHAKASVAARRIHHIHIYKHTRMHVNMQVCLGPRPLLSSQCITIFHHYLDCVMMRQQRSAQS